MFSDEWDEATPISLEPAEEETEVRGRSESNSSEKMGRFEVRKHTKAKQVVSHHRPPAF